MLLILPVYTINDRISGIVINNQSRWRILENTVHFLAPIEGGPIPHPGVTLNNSNYNRLFDNTVLDNVPTAESASTGFRTNISTNNIFCCNTTIGTYFGFRFSGACNGTQLRHNEMNNHSYCVSLRPKTAIGPQGAPDDPMTPQNEAITLGNRFAVGSGTAEHFGGQFEAALSVFHVTNMSPPHWPDAVEPDNFFVVNNVHANACIQDAYCNTPMGEIDPELGGLDLSTAQGVFAGASGGDAQQWESERDLYSCLKKSPALLGQSAALGAFFSARDAGGALKSFHEADGVVAETNVVPTVWGQTLQNAMDSVAQIEQAAEALLGTLPEGASEEDSLALYAQASDIRAKQAPFQQTILAFQMDMDSLRRVKAALALPDILALPEGDVLQSNRKTVHRVYLEWRASGSDTLTASQFAAIAPIAHQCPRTGGAAVYSARALYQIKEPKAFVDGDLCSPIEGRSVANKASAETKPLLWPNPSKGQFNLWVPGVSDGQSVQLQVMDLSGKTLQRFEIRPVGGNALIDVSSFPQGMYFCHIKVAGQTREALKLVVSK